ncbi:hypothetical protein [Nocardia sp. NPDC050175]|uniref:hypothetical protein n=1 Tax=Nocardia sp. NPDC050175 TaxID=3364317 RepID=UPI0037A1354A
MEEAADDAAAADRFAEGPDFDADWPAEDLAADEAWAFDDVAEVTEVGASDVAEAAEVWASEATEAAESEVTDAAEVDVLAGADAETSTASSAPVGSGVAANPAATVGAGSEAAAAAVGRGAPELDVPRGVAELDADGWGDPELDVAADGRGEAELDADGWGDAELDADGWGSPELDVAVDGRGVAELDVEGRSVAEPLVVLLARRTGTFRTKPPPGTTPARRSVRGKAFSVVPVSVPTVIRRSGSRTISSTQVNARAPSSRRVPSAPLISAKTGPRSRIRVPSPVGATTPNGGVSEVPPKTTAASRWASAAPGCSASATASMLPRIRSVAAVSPAR